MARLSPLVATRFVPRRETVGIKCAYEVLLADKVQSVSLPSGNKSFTLELNGLGTVEFSQVRQIS